MFIRYSWDHIIDIADFQQFLCLWRAICEQSQSVKPRAKNFNERPFIKKLNAGLMNKFGTRTETQPVNYRRRAR